MKFRVFPTSRALGIALFVAVASNADRLYAQTTWDGGGGTDTNWGAVANWDNDTSPAFDGTDSLSVTAGFGGNTAMTLGADRSIGRITFGGGATAISLSGNTLRLNSTATSAGAGTALWNANTADNVTATVHSNILLSSGAAGSYTGYFRENANSSGGTRFNGTITQGAGENWTLRFSRSGARGQFFLNNAANSISGIRNDGADVYSQVAGAFGGAALTLAGGFTGTRSTDHYTTAVNNDITVSAASTWVSHVQTRLTGTLTQGNQILNYGNGAAPSGSTLTRLEYSSVSGTGTTNLQAGGFAVSSMSQFASGTLNLGNGTSGGTASVILSGSSGNGVPTWSDFSSGRTFNQSGGAGSWRINVSAGQSDNVFNAGGFAARGADLVIPASGGGLSSATFTRNFVLGSAATLDGARYADHAVKIETAIDYGSLASPANRYFGAAWNVGAGKTLTQLTLAGPVHELAGAITGSNVIIYPVGLQDQATPGNSTTEFGIIRISNSANSLTGSSRWIIGGQRTSFTTMGGAVVPAPANMGDKASAALVFTSDAAFGGAAEVQVSAVDSSGSRNTGTLLFEDVNGSGSTTFSRAVNLLTSRIDVGGAAIGSYGGDVVYNGALTFGSGTLALGNAFMLHAQAGSTFTLNGGATFTNNSLGATTFNKTGGGTMAIDALAVGGTQTANSWNVRAGTLLANTTVAGDVTVSSGATLGGSGNLSGNVTTASGGNAIIAPGTSLGKLTCDAALNASNGGIFKMELGANTTPGTTYDQVAIGGTFTGSSAAGGLKFEFTASPGLTAGVPYTVLTFVGSSGLSYSDLAVTVLPAGFVLDTAFGADGWQINSDSVQVQFSSTGSDITPPSWVLTWPKADTATTSGFTVRARTDENGTAYYVVVVNGAPAPSAAEVKAGTAAGGGAALKNGSFPLAANFENTAPVTGLSANTPYDLYIVAEDAVPNLQTAAQLVDISTISHYTDWANGFPGFTNQGPTQDHDSDGLDNLVEFVLGGNPTLSDSPPVRPVAEDMGTSFKVTFKRSDSSELQPVTVTVQISDDLMTWNPANDVTIGDIDGSGPNGVTYTVVENGSAPDSITVIIPKGAAPKKFARVVATE